MKARSFPVHQIFCDHLSEALQQLTPAGKLAAWVKRGCVTILTVAAVAALLVARTLWDTTL